MALSVKVSHMRYNTQPTEKLFLICMEILKPFKFISNTAQLFFSTEH